ncbi:hypothetical protein OPV22_027281 [Ensete ventricosum]|uniref:Bifunctional inhibitor/plant lipid transfer protein/seed storage helical domain-containing protein n=1 Tax=Ensete ventricosum TaxID=4639 RepID=A0AAV8PZM5_ENSVE|nr:hypothetical protein OPV22_027281 [Ensete ventricosum]RWW78819.1 hypothetical protein BHE74_00012933 [Ensete ventricosum]
MKLRLLLSAAALPLVVVVVCGSGITEAGCRVELPDYVSVSCSAADAVFEAFSVCCEFLRRAPPPCLRSHLHAAVSVGADEDRLRECSGASP